MTRGRSSLNRLTGVGNTIIVVLGTGRHSPSPARPLAVQRGCTPLHGTQVQMCHHGVVENGGDVLLRSEVLPVYDPDEIGLTVPFNVAGRRKRTVQEEA